MKNNSIGALNSNFMNIPIPRRRRRLTLHLAIMLTAFWGTWKTATAYPTGSEKVNRSASQTAAPTSSAPQPNAADDVSLSGADGATEPSPSPSPKTAASDQAYNRFYVRRNEEFRLGDYSYIITRVRTGTATGPGFLRRVKASDASTYLFINYFIRNNGNEVAERLTDDMWIMDSNGRKYLPDERAAVAIPPDFAPQELQAGVSHKALKIFEVPRSVVKSELGIVVGEHGVTGTDRKLAKLAGQFSSPTPAPTPGSAKSKSQRVARRHSWRRGNPKYEDLRRDILLDRPWGARFEDYDLDNYFR